MFLSKKEKFFFSLYTLGEFQHVFNQRHTHQTPAKDLGGTLLRKAHSVKSHSCLWNSSASSWTQPPLKKISLCIARSRYYFQNVLFYTKINRFKQNHPLETEFGISKRTEYKTNTHKKIVNFPQLLPIYEWKGFGWYLSNRIQCRPYL